MSMKNLYEVKRNSSSVIDFVKGHFKDRREEISRLHRSWCLNLAWCRGDQNVDFDANSRTWLKNDPTDHRFAHRVRIISNMMLPLVRKSVAKLSYIHPVWDVIPATPDEVDIQIANISTKVLQDLWQQVDMNSKLIRLLFWMLNCGSAFFKVTWDAEAGDEIQIMSNELESESIQRVMEKFGFTEIPEAFSIPQGQLSVDVVTPFNITLNNNTECFDENNWVIESHLRSKDWVIEKFGKKYRDLTETDDTQLLQFPHLYSSNYRKDNKGVLVHELYVKRSKLFKKGLYCMIGGDEILISPRDNPYVHGQLPYTHFTEILTPGNIWGTCVSEQVRSNQARYNRISSGIIEHINLTSNLQWLNPSQNKTSIFTNEPGGVINYTYPYKPEPHQPRSLPSYVERMLDRTRMDMQDTASSHDVSEAKAEPGIRSGKAVLALQDADDSIYGPVLLMVDEALSKTGMYAIQTLAQYVNEQRTIYITGEYNAIEALTFTGAMLRGEKNQANYWRVRVKTFGRQAMSRSGREQLVRTLVELNILNPQIDRDKILHIMGTADLVSMFDQDAAARSYQNDEIQKLLQGQPAQVELGQNHVVHLEILKKFKNSGRWGSIPPQVRQLVDAHYVEHLKMQAYESILPQLLIQEQMNGTGQQGNAAAGQSAAAGQAAG